MEFITFFIIAFLIGGVGSIVGSGGGFLLVPILLFLTDLSPQAVAGTSLAVVLLSSLSSTVAYRKQKKLDSVLAKTFIFASIPGTIIGVYINQLISIAGLALIFGILLIIISIILFKDKRILIPHFIPRPIHVKRKMKYSTGEVMKYEFSIRRSGFISFLIGVISPIVGIGGGVLRTPLMIIIIGIPPKVAAATSQSVTLVGSFVAVILFAAHSQIDYFLAFVLGIGIILGAQIGAQISKKTKPKNVKLLMAIVVLLVGVWMLLKSFGVV